MAAALDALPDAVFFGFPFVIWAVAMIYALTSERNRYRALYEREKTIRMRMCDSDQFGTPRFRSIKGGRS